MCCCAFNVGNSYRLRKSSKQLLSHFLWCERFLQSIRMFSASSRPLIFMFYLYYPTEHCFFFDSGFPSLLCSLQYVRSYTCNTGYLVWRSTQWLTLCNLRRLRHFAMLIVPWSLAGLILFAKGTGANKYVENVLVAFLLQTLAVCNCIWTICNGQSFYNWGLSLLVTVIHYASSRPLATKVYATIIAEIETKRSRLGRNVYLAAQERSISLEAEA